MSSSSPEWLDHVYERIRFDLKSLYRDEAQQPALKHAVTSAISALGALDVEVQREKARREIRSAEQALQQAHDLLAALGSVNTPT
jgi:hypothetical protein